MFKRLLAFVHSNLSGLEKFSIILTLVLAICFPAASSIYILGQHKQALETLTTQMNDVPTEQEFNLQLQLRDVRLQRLEYQLGEALRKLDEIREDIRRTHE